MVPSEAESGNVLHHLKPCKDVRFHEIIQRRSFIYHLAVDICSEKHIQLEHATKPSHSVTQRVGSGGVARLTDMKIFRWGAPSLHAVGY